MRLRRLKTSLSYNLPARMRLKAVLKLAVALTLALTIFYVFSNYRQHLSAVPHSTKKASKWKPAQTAVREMTVFAWGNYRNHAWGSNELSPGAFPGSNPNTDALVGPGNGLTIIDSLSTLRMMDLHEEFEDARHWIAQDFNFCKTSSLVSVFEVNIRLLGGLLSAFSFSKDTLFLDKAIEVADCLMLAFNTSTGIPHHFTRPSSKHRETGSLDTTLADAGTLDLEFSFLSDMTGDQKYREAVTKTRDILLSINNAKNGENLLAININILTAQTTGPVSLGASGDSFYEYQLKRYIYKRDPKDKDLYENFLENIRKNLLVKVGNRTCVTTRGSDECRMEHLTCFAGGMFALGSKHSSKFRKLWLEVAENVTETCYQSYRQSNFGLGSEHFTFTEFGLKAESRPNMYLLRPETVESIFYLSYITENEKYRRWSEEIVRALNKETRLEHGFSGIKTHGSLKHHDLQQQSFFIAETLKYLYMTLTEQQELLIDLDNWVFNTEAHPLPTIINPLWKQLMDIGRTHVIKRHKTR